MTSIQKRGISTRETVIIGLVIAFMVTKTWALLFLAGAVAIFWDIGKSNLGVFSVDREAQADMKNFGCEIPKDPDLQKLVNTLYAQKRKYSQLHPEFRRDCEDLLDQMWKVLSATHDKDKWVSVVNQTKSKWETVSNDVQEEFSKKLDEFASKTKRWRSSARPKGDGPLSSKV